MYSYKPLENKLKELDLTKSGLTIIEDSKKSFYYRGLANWNQEKGWLRDTCLDGQDTFKRILNVLDIHE